MSSSFLAFFGHVNIDVSIRVPVLPKVGSINATGVSENYGGTAGNFAMVANRLGLDFDLYSAVSTKSHSSYLSYMKESGISTDHLTITGESYGPVVYITSDGNDQVAYIFQGPMEKWEPSLDKGKEYKWVHISTGPPEGYSGLLSSMGGSRFVFDPGQEIHYRYSGEEASRFMERADLFIGNDAEMEKLSSLTGMSVDDIVSSVGTAIITRGTRGITLMGKEGNSDFSILPARKVHDTIGAGDSFRAGFYYGLSRGMGMQDAIGLGAVVSSRAVEEPMTSFRLSGPEAEALYRDNREKIQPE